MHPFLSRERTRKVRSLLFALSPDTATFPRRMTAAYARPMKTWMRRRGDRVKITTGKYAGHTGTVESNVYQRTVDYPDEFANLHHVMLETEDLVTVRWDQVDV